MKILNKIFDKVNYILFLDIEGTQNAHEVIELGAILVKIDENHHVDESFSPKTFRKFCLAHEPVGRIVTKITGITDTTVQDNGITFLDAIKELNKMVCNLGDSLIVATFGNQDALMLKNSAKYYENDPFINSFITYLVNRVWDFSSFIYDYIRNEHNQACSLLKLLEIFNVKSSGQAHDALIDATNFLNIYKKMTSSSEILASEYIKVLKNNLSMISKSPVVNQFMINLVNKNDITYQDFFNALIKYFE